MKRSESVVLIVDDNASVRTLLSLCIRERGYSFLLAANGQQALSMSRAYPGKIDLLLSDVDMPQMNGFDLARQLIKERPGVRVLMISGVERATFGLPFLRKPFLPHDLWRKLEQVFSSAPCRWPETPLLGKETVSAAGAQFVGAGIPAVPLDDWMYENCQLPASARISELRNSSPA